MRQYTLTISSPVYNSFLHKNCRATPDIKENISRSKFIGLSKIFIISYSEKQIGFCLIFISISFVFVRFDV